MSHVSKLLNAAQNALNMYQDVCSGFIQSFAAFRCLISIHELLQECLMKGTTANMSTM